MTDHKTPEQTTERDRLLTRPEDPLPTAQDPQARGNPADPKLDRPGGQDTDPHAGDLDYSV
jgi:hypothetical protein